MDTTDPEVILLPEKLIAGYDNYIIKLFV